jgi:hypothetical protein
MSGDAILGRDRMFAVAVQTSTQSRFIRMHRDSISTSLSLKQASAHVLQVCAQSFKAWMVAA